MNKTLIQKKEISRLVKKAVAKTFQDFFKDPDFGLELQEWVKKRLMKKSTKTVSFSEIRKRYL